MSVGPEMAMNVKEAVKAAKEYTADLLADEGVINLGLEEVEWNERDGVWQVTVGFSRPWNSVRNTLTAITGENSARRAYRVVSLRDDGTVVSMKRRETVDD
jgi:hypothetical protein